MLQLQNSCCYVTIYFDKQIIMILKICLPVPDKTRAYLYKYEQILRSYAKKILMKYHYGTKANKRILQNNPKDGYDDIRGTYIYFDYVIKNDQDNRTIWLEEE